MFALSKIGWLLVEPGNVLLCVLAAALILLWRGRVVAARRLVTGAVLALAWLAFTPTGVWMLTLLENRFPVVTVLPAQVDGVLVLGGALDPYLTAQRGQPELHEGSERILALVDLAARFPNAQVVFTGGNGTLDPLRPDEATALRPLLLQLGVDGGRVTFEDKSRNTFENAVFSRALVNPGANTRWLLVTSATHMPRAMGVFRHAGWDVMAYPVDHLTPGDYSYSPPLSVTMGVQQAALAFKEMLGMLAYRLMGRMAELFPGA